VLEGSGYDVLTALSGRDGLKLVSQGSKIDLVIVDYLMPGMNGDEVADSIKSEFPRLPVIAMSAVHLPSHMLKTVDAYIQKGQDVEILLSTISKTLGTSGVAGEEQSMDGKTVLCADDDERELTARKMLFESAGYKVLIARSGLEALEIFRKQAPDAVVLDYWMPGMKGLSVASEMKSLRPEIPIMVLSGFASLPDETIGVVDAWLQKRDVEVLLRELEKMIQRKSSSGPSN
jgi:CheY-like chemotaxis protein